MKNWSLQNSFSQNLSAKLKKKDENKKNGTISSEKSLRHVMIFGFHKKNMYFWKSKAIIKI